MNATLLYISLDYDITTFTSSNMPSAWEHKLLEISTQQKWILDQSKYPDVLTGMLHKRPCLQGKYAGDVISTEPIANDFAYVQLCIISHLGSGERRYHKPQAVLEVERTLQEEFKKMKAAKDGDVDCNPS
ncbi:hypothetical protein C0Q70_09018 [Pomacea canaliculata]|uniref:Uncharacterized protein n=1 Tax=Pomacea canaliculata TaxID=400727 RepID=A0A2T7P8M6_POMCA|nr:hypothetical protein C0Q70_09018 [Pomacea canaliculata]